MKKKKVIIIILTTILCCIGIMVIFQRYQSWTNQAFDKLISENLKAYSDSQNTEVVSKVEDVRTTLKTIAQMIQQVEESGADTKDYEKYLDAVSQNEDIQAQGIVYFRFDEINIEQMSEADLKLIEVLKKGEPVISDIYPSADEEDGDMYYGIAEPVVVNGQSIGFVRGMITSKTLLHSSQQGFLSDSMESYLIHEDGRNAFLDYLPNEEQPNMLDILSEASNSQNEISRVRENIKEKKQEVIKIEAKDGEQHYVSYSFLPYKDWVILNVCSSREADKYAVTLENNGKRFMVLLVGFTGVVILFVGGVFYYGSRERRFERRRTDLLVNFSDTLLCEYDWKRDILRCTSNTSKLLEIEQTKLEHFEDYIIETGLVNSHDFHVLKKIRKECTDEEKVHKYELRLKSREKNYIWCRLNVIRMNTGKESRLVIKITDISGEKEKEKDLMKKARQDTMTDLLNREAFEEQVQECLDHNQGGYLFLLDLDDFKNINDIYGHAAGDESIRKVGSILRNSFRINDIVGRYGGDEFYAFALGNLPEEIISKRAAGLTESVSRIRLQNAEELHITCSIGIVKCQEGSLFADCLKKADKVMYEAKRQGKNSWILQ